MNFPSLNLATAMSIILVAKGSRSIEQRHLPLPGSMILDFVTLIFTIVRCKVFSCQHFQLISFLFPNGHQLNRKRRSCKPMATITCLVLNLNLDLELVL